MTKQTNYQYFTKINDGYMVYVLTQEAAINSSRAS
jgi:hypothetical protein